MQRRPLTGSAHNWCAHIPIVEAITIKGAIDYGHRLLALAQFEMQPEKLGPCLQVLRDRSPGPIGLDPGAETARQSAPGGLTFQTIDFRPPILILPTLKLMT